MTNVIQKGQFMVVEGGKKHFDKRCVLLEDDWDSKSGKPIPYVNYWFFNIKPRTKKVIWLNRVHPEYWDLYGGRFSTSCKYFHQASKKLIELCTKSIEEIKRSSFHL